MPARVTPLSAGFLVPALFAVVGTALFIAGDLLGPSALRPIGGCLALGAYAALMIIHRPATPRTEADAEPRGQGARHVA